MFQASCFYMANVTSAWDRSWQIHVSWNCKQHLILYHTSLSPLCNLLISVTLFIVISQTFKIQYLLVNDVSRSKRTPSAACLVDGHIFYSLRINVLSFLLGFLHFLLKRFCSFPSVYVINIALSAYLILITDSNNKYW